MKPEKEILLADYGHPREQSRDADNLDKDVTEPVTPRLPRGISRPPKMRGCR